MRIMILEMNLLMLMMIIKQTMPLMKVNTMMTGLERKIEEEHQPQAPPAQHQERPHITQLQGQSQELQV